MYEYLVLDRSNAHTYQHLTLEVFYQYLQQLSDLESIAIGATFKGQPVGLILAHYRQNQSQARILSLMVDPEHRQQGIGATLLIQIEEILTASGYQQVEPIYNLNQTTPMLERILQHQNWTPGSDCSIRYLTNRATILQAPFLNRYTVPEKYTIFPWSELTDRERGVIERREHQLDYPDILCPFEKNQIYTLGSVGLRHQGEVIGWSIVTQSTPTFVNFRSQFVKSEFRAVGLGVHLLVASLQRQSLDEKATNGSFAVSVENTRMLRFINRHLAPYLTGTYRYLKSFKSIKSARSSDRKLSSNLPSIILSQG